MQILKTIRDELLAEAKKSPEMLQDIAGLERYVSESYSSRVFIELLQNSDDAGATDLTFMLGDGWLAVANNGREFSLGDFRSLCRSASSNKVRGSGIGYRGIGFKSVVGITEQIHMYSGELEASFSRKLTSEEIGFDIPVPLIRIPHSLQLDRNSSAGIAARQLINEGSNTVFILEGLNRGHVIEEFNRFDSDYLIFLKSIEIVNMVHATTEQYSSRRRPTQDSTIAIETRSGTRAEEWRIHQNSGISIAFSIIDDRYVALRPDQSVVHAFLPTQEQCGFNFRVNGDFSTDPSRTRVVLDETSDGLISSLADFITKLIEDNLLSETSYTSKSILECLAPNVDETVLQLQRRSFRSELVGAVRERLQAIRNRVFLTPAWLGSSEANNLKVADNSLVLSQSSQTDADAAVRISRFAGCEVITTRDLLYAATEGKLTVSGRVDLIAHFAQSIVLNNVSAEDFFQAKIWESHAGPMSIPEMIAGQHSLSRGFEELLSERGVEIRALSRRLSTLEKNIFSDHIADVPGSELTIISNPVTQHERFTDEPPANGAALVDQPLPKWTRSKARIGTASNASQWRSAELTVLELFSSLGYVALDHSRQNLGYDIIATVEAETLYVEVKSISYPGQPFSLTPNEDSFARDSHATYIVALVYRAKGSTQIQLISDPRNTLEFVKQCRQWAWECNEYNFAPDYELNQS
nr:DUF3883 domain-containing protein [Rhodococcus sp. 15-1154-1]